MLLKKVISTLVLVSLFIFPQVVFGLAPGEPDIFLQIEPGTLEVAQGASGTVTITAISQEGFEDDVSLTLVDPPTGITATFDPNPFLVPSFDAGSSIMTITVDAATELGEVVLTINAKAAVEDVEKEKSITVTVTEAAGNGDGNGGVGNGDGNGGVGNGDGNGGQVTVTTTTVTLSTTISTEITVTESIILTSTETTNWTITETEGGGPPVERALSELVALLIAVAAIAVIAGAVISIRRSK